MERRDIRDKHNNLIAVYDPNARALLIRQRYWHEGRKKHVPQTVAIPLDALLEGKPITIDTDGFSDPVKPKA